MIPVRIASRTSKMNHQLSKLAHAKLSSQQEWKLTCKFSCQQAYQKWSLCQKIVPTRKVINVRFLAKTKTFTNILCNAELNSTCYRSKFKLGFYEYDHYIYFSDAAVNILFPQIKRIIFFAPPAVVQNGIMVVLILINLSCDH